MNKQQKIIAALTAAARKKPKYRPGIKAKIKAVKQREANFKWLAQ
jgi:hypothetical protein